MAYEHGYLVILDHQAVERLRADGTWTSEKDSLAGAHRLFMAARLETEFQNFPLRVTGDSARLPTPPLPPVMAPNGRPITSPVAFFLNHVTANGWEVVSPLPGMTEPALRFLLRRKVD